MDKPLPTTIDSYDDAVRWIYGRINYEQTEPRPSSTHFRLERTERLLSLIGSPQSRIPAVHLAGTKGKGSTAAMVDSILRTSGYRTGLFTSPHIRLFEERMQVDGVMPDQRQLTRMVARLASILEEAHKTGDAENPTYFEVATLLAWMYFDECDIDIVVLETGLGGRLDCTNVCRPLITAITTIGLDHTHILGDTVEKIAAEKAGIIKPDIPVVSAVTQPGVIDVLKTYASENHSPLYLLGRDFSFETASGNTCFGSISVSNSDRTIGDLSLSLAGSFQRPNAAVATMIADLLSNTLDQINDATICKGLQNTKWPMRLEIFECPGTIVLDAAHNPDAVAALLDSLEDICEREQQRVMIFASSRDKDATGMLRHIVPAFEHVVLTQFETNPRGIPIDHLLSLAEECSKAANARGVTTATLSTATDPEAALEHAKQLAGPTGMVCVAGSIFVSAEVRGLLTEQIDA